MLGSAIDLSFSTQSQWLHSATKLDSSFTQFRSQGVGAVRGKELIHEVCPDSKSSTLTALITLLAVISIFANNSLLSPCFILKPTEIRASSWCDVFIR